MTNILLTVAGSAKWFLAATTRRQVSVVAMLFVLTVGRLAATTSRTTGDIPIDRPTSERNQEEARVPGEEHPLNKTLAWAEGALQRAKLLDDYTCTFWKRERVGGTLLPAERIHLKVRNEPFSVYMRFDGPASMRGQEALFAAGENDEALLAHGAGFRGDAFGTLRLNPRGPLAMRNNRYPITEVGLVRMIERLLTIGRQDARYGECEVTHIPRAKVAGAECSCVQVVHPVARREFRFHVARIYIDDRLNLPVRFEAYDWPSQGDNRPVLMEEYTLTDLDLNPGLSEVEFDPSNPNYRFHTAVATD